MVDVMHDVLMEVNKFPDELKLGKITPIYKIHFLETIIGLYHINRFWKNL